MAMELSFRGEPSMSKGLWKVLKIVLAMIWKSLKSNRKQIEGLVESIKQGNLERNAAGKAFHVGFDLQDFEFSCKNSPNPIGRFELAKNKRRFLPCISLPTVIEDYTENECYTGKNGGMLFSVMGTPLIIFNCRGSPVSPPFLSPYPKSYLKYSPNNEVDHRAEEFIRWFRNQFLKLRSEAPRGVVGPKYSV